MAPLRQVLRRLTQSPLFTAIALITLALATGANTAVFGVLNSVLIKPLPYPQADRLLAVWHLAPGIPGASNLDINLCPSMYFTYREENRTFQSLGAWTGGGATITGVAQPEQVTAAHFTYGVLEALSVPPALGRWFSQADDEPGAAGTVILTNGYWQRHFGGDPSALGRTITIDSTPHRVIGIMPASFEFRNNPELILPMQFDRAKTLLGDFSYQGIARLKPGVTIEQANADIVRMLPIWLNAWPPPPGFTRALFENARLSPTLRPLKQDVVGNIGPTLWVLMGTIGLVLLIACANVANLLLVRAEGRQQELAIRAALGAGWGRIARELLLESLTLGLVGGALGLGLAYAGLRVLVAKGPETLPRLNDIGIDPMVLGFTLGVALLTGLLFGLIPVIKYAGPNLAGALRSGGRSLSQGRERHRARNTLVVVQVALALVLLIGSGLMIRTFQALHNVQPGFSHPEELQLLRVYIPEEQVKDPEALMRMQNQILNKLAAIPGVTSVAFANSSPLEGYNPGDILYAQDKDYTGNKVPAVRRFRFITPGFFETTGTPLIAGRMFTWADLYQKHRVAMVSENLAREMWGGAAAAIGKQIRETAADPWREIVGVVGDVHDNGVQEAAPAFAYWPAMMDQWHNETRVTRGGSFVVRTTRAGTESFRADATKAVWSENSNLPVFLVRTVKELADQSMARTSFTLVMLAIAGGMALVLGIVGIYGVIAYAVSQRTREMGIRLALGARPAALQGLFVRQALLLAATGAALGLAAAAGLTRLMSSLLFGVSAFDPVTYSAVAGLLITAAALASYVPARRASAVDPMEALRAE